MCGYCVYVKIKISQGFHNETVPVLDWIVRLLANTKCSGDRHWATFTASSWIYNIVVPQPKLKVQYNNISYANTTMHLQCITMIMKCL